MSIDGNGFWVLLAVLCFLLLIIGGVLGTLEVSHHRDVRAVETMVAGGADPIRVRCALALEDSMRTTLHEACQALLTEQQP